MAKFEIVSLCALLALLACVDLSSSMATAPVSYIDDVEISYTDGIWKCDKITCPAGTSSCRIVRKNTELAKSLVRANICYDEQQKSPLSSAFIEELVVVRTIDVDITSYVGAKSEGILSHSRNSQQMRGTIDPKEWQKFQGLARDTLSSSEESSVTY